jgi:hypothetical protein
MREFTDDEFQDYCIAECARLGTFPSYRYSSPEAKLEYCKWIYQKARGDGQKVKRLIDELVNQYGKLPMICELAMIWLRLFPMIHERPAVSCIECNGTGYSIVEVDLVSGAKRCPQGCLVPDGSLQSVSASARPPSSDGTSTPFERQPGSTRGRLRRPTAKAVSGLLFE